MALVQKVVDNHHRPLLRMRLQPLILAHLRVLVGLLAALDRNLLQRRRRRIQNLRRLAVQRFRKARLHPCRTLRHQVNCRVDRVHPREDGPVADLVRDRADRRSVAARFLDRLAVDQQLVLAAVEGLVDDELALAGAAGALHDDESLGVFHEPGADLVHVDALVVADGAHARFPLAAGAVEVEEVGGLAYEPAPGATVADVKGAGDVCLDKPRADAETRISIDSCVSNNVMTEVERDGLLTDQTPKR